MPSLTCLRSKCHFQSQGDRNDVNGDGDALKSVRKVLEGKEKIITVDTETLQSIKLNREALKIIFETFATGTYTDILSKLKISSFFSQPLWQQQ